MTPQEITGEFLLLNQAIRHFAPPALVAEYDRRATLPKPTPPRKRRGQSNVTAQLEHLIELEKYQCFVDEPWEGAKRYLFALIFHKKVAAWGVMKAPYKRINLEPIPSEFFDNPREGFWEANVIKKHGYCYVSVVVVLPRSAEAANSGAKPLQAAPCQIPQPERDLPSPAPSSSGKPRGRPPVVEAIRTVIRELRAEGALDNKTKQGMHFAIAKAARLKFPDLFTSDKNPGPDKIREALRAEPGIISQHYSPKITK
jgi:hypothetical protein